MYVFNKITVTPQLPDRINKLSEIADNLWWAWNTDFLKLFKVIDGDLWETVGKNPIKFLKLVSQEKLERVSENPELKFSELVKIRYLLIRALPTLLI